MLKKLTVIITFLNEGEEVVKTIKSIRQTAGENVDIILINDNSTDQFDYYNSTVDYKVIYHENSVRKGVAASRNIGVSLCKTSYFIIIDGHMRFFRDKWWKIIIDNLEQDSRAVYCTVCKPFGSNKKEKNGYGAYISFFGENFSDILHPKWIPYEFAPKENTADIPCVLGASYCMSVEYWNKIKGLNFLRYYGEDEAFLSLKVWLEGGKCKLINNVTIAHKFRKQQPYPTTNIDSIYNKLVISHLLMDECYNEYINSKFISYGQEYLITKAAIKRQGKEIDVFKTYINKHFSGKFETFNHINNRYKIPQSEKQDEQTQLKNIADYLLKERYEPQNTGLMCGNLGCAVFLFEYSRFSGEKKYKKTAENIIESIINEPNFTKIDVFEGLSGIIIGLAYLIKRKFIDLDIWAFLGKNILLQLQKNMEVFFQNNNNNYLQGGIGLAYNLLYINKEYDITKYLKKYLSNITSENTNFQTLNDIILYLLHLKKSKQVDSLIEKAIKIYRQIKNEHLHFQYFLLYKSYKYLGKPVAELIENLKTCANNKETIHNAVKYINMNGTSGLSYIYGKLYNETLLIDFKNASEFWQQETLLRSNGKRVAGYEMFGTSLYFGIAGLGLSLLHHYNHYNNWDSLFMLDI